MNNFKRTFRYYIYEQVVWCAKMMLAFLCWCVYMYFISGMDVLDGKFVNKFIIIIYGLVMAFTYGGTEVHLVCRQALQYGATRKNCIISGFICNVIISFIISVLYFISECSDGIREKDIFILIIVFLSMITVSSIIKMVAFISMNTIITRLVIVFAIFILTFLGGIVMFVCTTKQISITYNTQLQIITVIIEMVSIILCNLLINKKLRKFSI